MGRIGLTEKSHGFKQDPGHDILAVVPRKKKEEREKID